jgi:hypothetical protein
MASKSIYERLSGVDSRVLYLLVGIVLAIPLLFPLNLETFYTRSVTRVFERLEEIRDNGVILLGLNYDASVKPEVEPMVRSIIRHAFLRNIRILAYGWNPEGALLAQQLFDELSAQYGKAPGVDYVNFGYRIPYFPIVLGIGTDLWQVLPADMAGRPVSEMPMMANIRTYQDIDLVIDFTGGSSTYTWVYYAHTRFGVQVAAGVTGVIAAELYPLLQTKQLQGLLSGMKDAAEYEKHADEVEEEVGFGARRRANFERVLRERPGAESSAASIEEQWEIVRLHDRRARRGMDSQAMAHLLLILFIVAGNVGYFGTRRRKRQHQEVV